MQTSRYPQDSTPSLNHWLKNDKLQLLLKKTRELQEINHCIQQICDTELTRNCRAANWEEPYLTLQVESAAWGMRLRFMDRELRSVLSTLPFLKSLQEIRFRIQPTVRKPAAPYWPAQTLSASNREILSDIADSISDEKLRAALKKLCQE